MLCHTFQYTEVAAITIFTNHVRRTNAGRRRSHGHDLDTDPLRPLLRLHKVDAKAIERRIADDTAAKISSIQATLKKRKTKQACKTDRSSAQLAQEKSQTETSSPKVN